MIGTVSARARAKVRAYVESHMDATVTILRGGLGELDRATGLVGGLTDPTVVYTGKARIHSVDGQGNIAVGQAEVDQRQTTIAIPWDAPPVFVDDVLRVEQDELADPDQDGAAYRVIQVQGGSLFGDCTRLSCTGWYPNRRWSPT